MDRHRSMCACALLLLVLGGCTYERGGLVRQSDRVIRERTRTEPNGSEAAIRVSQDDTLLVVHGEQLCENRRHELVETTHTYARTSGSTSLMLTLGIGGAAAIGGGSLLAANVFGYPPAELRRPGDDSPTAEMALVVGIVLIGVGAIVATVAATHAFGLLFTDDETTARQVDRGPVGTSFRCDPVVPLSGVAVSLPGERRPLALGVLGPSGELSVDLASVLTPAFLLRHRGRSVPVSVGERAHVGEIDLEPFQRRLDEAAWAAAASTRCAGAETAAECRGVESYLAQFPSGAHADEGRRLLEAVRERLAERARLAAEQRRAEAEQRRLELERWQAEEEQRRRAERAERDREQQARRAEAAERQRQLEEQAQRRAARAACERTCRESCAGSFECQSRCVAQQCR